MKRPQRRWWWPWVALPFVPFASAVMLNFELDVFALILAGLFALAALRQFRGRPTNGSQPILMVEPSRAQVSELTVLPFTRRHHGSGVWPARDHRSGMTGSVPEDAYLSASGGGWK